MCAPKAHAVTIQLADNACSCNAQHLRGKHALEQTVSRPPVCWAWHNLLATPVKGVQRMFTGIVEFGDMVCRACKL